MNSKLDVFKEKYPNLYQEYIQIQEEQLELFAKKMLSYGIDNISLGSDLNVPENRKMSLMGVFIRCLDKTNRMKNMLLHNNENPLDKETIVDTYQDLVNYNIIAQIITKGNWK